MDEDGDDDDEALDAALERDVDAPEVEDVRDDAEDEDAGENTVVEVFQKGFALGDKVLRFSVVKVAN